MPLVDVVKSGFTPAHSTSMRSRAKPKSEHKRRGRPPKVREVDPGDPPKLSKLEEEEARRQRREERETLKKLEAQARIDREKARILAGKPVVTSLPGPKDYDWKAVFLEIYRLSKSSRDARQAAEISYTTFRDAKREDPIFAQAVADIGDQITEEHIDRTEIVRDGVFEAAAGVGTPGPFGTIDPARVASAKMWLQAYDPARFGERIKVQAGVTLALPGVLLQAISEAAGRMSFEALPEAQATVVEAETW